MNKYFYKPYMAVVLCVLSVNPSVQADEHSIHKTTAMYGL